jgi:hypothetical protein
LSPATELSCNYASDCDGCSAFGASFPCQSEVPAASVDSNNVLMTLAEDWSESLSSFTIELGTEVGSAETGHPNPTINEIPGICHDDVPLQLTAVSLGGLWSEPRDVLWWIMVQRHSLFIIKLVPLHVMRCPPLCMR